MFSYNFLLFSFSFLLFFVCCLFIYKIINKKLLCNNNIINVICRVFILMCLYFSILILFFSGNNLFIMC